MRGGPAGGRGMMRGMPRGNLRGRARGGVMRGALSMRGVLFFLSFFLTSPNMLKTTPSSSLLSNMRSCQPLFDTGVSYGNAYIDRSYILQVIVAFSWRELLRQSSLTIINTTLLSLIGKRLSTGVPMRGRGSAGRLSMRRGGRNRGGGAGRGGPMSRGAPRGVARGQNWLHYWPGHSKLLFFFSLNKPVDQFHLLTGRGGLRGRGGFPGRGGRGRGRGAGRPAVTREQLDNQLDAYMSKTKGHLDAELDAYMAQADPDSMEWPLKDTCLTL